MIIDNAVYVMGARTTEPLDLEQTIETMRAYGGMGWIGLYRPTETEMSTVSAEFGLHPLAVEDTINAHQRPKVELYDDVLFTVLRPARYVDAEERVEFGELHVFTGKDFVITVRHTEASPMAPVRQRLEADGDLLTFGPMAVLYAIIDQVVDDYGPVVDGLQTDIDQIEDQVFAGDAAVTRRIYELSREVIAFQRAVHPLVHMLDRIGSGFDLFPVHKELRRNVRDVADHVARVNGQVDGFRTLLQEILQVDSTLTTNRQNEQAAIQNEQVKRISSWAAILFAPTLVASIYGMNFDTMPELHWLFGYPYALGLMLGMGLVLWLVFRHNKWL